MQAIIKKGKKTYNVIAKNEHQKSVIAHYNSLLELCKHSEAKKLAKEIISFAS